MSVSWFKKKIKELEVELRAEREKVQKLLIAGREERAMGSVAVAKQLQLSMSLRRSLVDDRMREFHVVINLSEESFLYCSNEDAFCAEIGNYVRHRLQGEIRRIWHRPGIWEMKA